MHVLFLYRHYFYPPYSFYLFGVFSVFHTASIWYKLCAWFNFIIFIYSSSPSQFFGVMKDGTSWGATADINGFVGIIPLLLSIWIMVRNRSKQVLFFTISVIVAFLLALGKYSPLYLLAFYFLPFFSRFRSPTSILIIYTFSLSILAGYAIDYLFNKIKLGTKNDLSPYPSL